jgi:hypothetical protein
MKIFFLMSFFELNLKKRGVCGGLPRISRINNEKRQKNNSKKNRRKSLES